MKMTKENLIKAEQTAKLLVSDLNEACRSSTSLLKIDLMPLLEQALKIERELKTLNGELRRSDAGKG